MDLEDSRKNDNKSYYQKDSAKKLVKELGQSWFAFDKFALLRG